MPGEKGRKRKITDQSEVVESEKSKAKAKPRKSAVKEEEDQKVEGGSPAKKKGRKSTGGSK
jgi:hypothetical protein